MIPRPGRRASDLFIAAFLLLQVALPLRYYLRGDERDERFAWRMFSSRGQQRCEVRVEELVEEGSGLRPRAVHLPSEVAGVWVALLENGRPQVVRRMLERRCELPGVREVAYRRDCVATDGARLAPGEASLACGSESLRGHERGR